MDLTQPNTIAPRPWAPFWLALATSSTLAFGVTVPAPRGMVHLEELVAGTLIGLLPAAFVALVALALIAVLSGKEDARAGLRHLLGRADESELLRAAHSLGLAANWALGLGLAIGAIAMLGVVDYVRIQLEAGERSANPAELARLAQAMLISIPSGLVIGRFVLGSAADAAAIRAGLESRVRGTNWLLASILLPVALMTIVFAKFPTL